LLRWGVGGLALTIAFDALLAILVVSLYGNGALSRSDANLVAYVGLVVGTVLGTAVIVIGVWRFARKAKATRDSTESR